MNAVRVVLGRASLCCLLLLTATAYARDLPPVRESQPLGAGAGGASASSGSIESRLSKVEALVEGQTLVDMLTQIEELQNNVQELRGQVEVQTHEIEGLRQRQRDLYMDIDRRLRQQSGGAAETPAQPADGGAKAGPTAGSAAAGAAAGAGAAAAGKVAAAGSEPPAGGGDSEASIKEQNDYQQAFNVLKDGRYDESIKAFKGFLAHYPNGKFADNAHYWIGEASYVTRNFDQAATEFDIVVSKYPDSNKLPDAMLKLGFAHYELKHWQQARQTLTALTNRFPDSTPAEMAKSRLHRMKLEGH